MQKIAAHPGVLAANLALVDGAFTTYLRTQRRAPRTISHIRWAVRHAAWWLACRHRSLDSLRLGELPEFLKMSAARCWGSYTQEHYRAGIHWWVHFKHPQRNPGFRLRRPRDLVAYPWQSYVDEFIKFLVEHRGLASRTLIGYRDVVRSFLIWRFGMSPADWRRVGAQDVWRYARSFGRGRKPATLNHDLRYLRRFFVFLEMRGACSAQLAQAVPRFWNFGQASRVDPLSDRQRRTLLACFSRRSAEGLRDYCLAACMVDLGLRPVEVASLTLQSIDWSRHVLSVPPTKTDRGRQLPLVERIATALRTYVDRHRPPAESSCLFVHHGKRRTGDAMDSRAVRRVIGLAYKRCGFPPEWQGSYRLRHTFATRLHARGADLKQIADLLYLAHRRALGFTLEVDHRQLPKLARFHQRMAPGQPLRTDVILKWAVLPNTGSRNYYVKRLAMARSFARYCAALEPRTQIPDYRLLGRGYQKSAPHIYSPAEIRLLLQRARRLSARQFPHRPITFVTLLGLIACTGMRLNEALRLRCGDFDFNAGTIRVPHSKFSPERVLPLHSSTVRAMRRYLRARSAAQISGDHFFFNRFGKQLGDTSVHHTFREIAKPIACTGALPRPRIHDLRHTFATRHIAQWHRQAAPVAHRLLLLSRYLGHQNFTDTWWYVSADPSTLRDAAARFQRFQRGEQ